ncbi:SpaH/EbpB family LPXTG-anchored major pilin [Arcanobacterium canis]
MTKKSIRAVAATTMMALALSFGVGSAFAAPEVSTQGQDGSQVQPGVGFENINKYHEGVIDIHKILNPSKVGKEATGDTMDDVTGKPLGGVTFNATKLDYDLTTEAGWKDLKALNGGNLKTLKANQIPEDKKTKTVVTGVTAKGTGVTELKVPVGVYIVSEDTKTVTPEISGLSEEEIKSLRGGEDFLVFVPTTTPDGKAWDYKVTVYPKNTTTKVTKKVEDASKNVGDFIDYTIETTVPAPSSGFDRTEFSIEDKYDKDKLDATSVKDIWVTVNTEKKILDQDYTINNDQLKGLLTVTFKNPQDLPNNSEVKLSFGIKVKNEGVIVNEATSIDNDSNPKTKQRRTPSNKVVTYIGKVKVLKQSDGRDGDIKSLSGAKFEVYKCDESGKKTSGAALSVNGVSSWTTNDKGELEIPGLHVTDIQNSTERIAGMYCLKEIEAPAGYILPADAITPFTLTVNTKNTVDDYNDDVIELKLEGTGTPLDKLSIVNKKSDTPDLPLTGGQGIR